MPGPPAPAFDPTQGQGATITAPSPWAYGPGYPNGYGYPPRSTLEPGARTSLVVAIVGLFICAPIFCPAAIYEGVKAQKKIRESYGTLHGTGLATAGIVIGSIGSALAVLWMLAIVASS